MDTTCPHCGKIMNVSVEELAQRDGQVVCPQCLRQYQAVPPENLPRPMERTPARAATASSLHYCPHCGHALSESTNYCPHCGNSLRPATTAHHSPMPEAIASAPAEETMALGEQKGAANDFQWVPLIPSYRYVGRHSREPASRRFQAVAIAVIIALLTLLAFIIYQAMKL